MEALVGINISLCSGCQACCVACMDQNNLAVEVGSRGWRIVRKVESGAFPHAKIICYSVSCLNCASQECLEACPSGALFLSEDNDTVQVDPSQCIGCQACASACPHEMPQFEEEGTVEKCDGCIQLTKQGF